MAHSTWISPSSRPTWCLIHDAWSMTTAVRLCFDFFLGTYRRLSWIVMISGTESVKLENNIKRNSELFGEVVRNSLHAHLLCSRHLCREGLPWAALRGRDHHVCLRARLDDGEVRPSSWQVHGLLHDVPRKLGGRSFFFSHSLLYIVRGSECFKGMVGSPGCLWSGIWLSAISLSPMRCPPSRPITLSSLCCPPFGLPWSCLPSCCPTFKWLPITFLSPARLSSLCLPPIPSIAISPPWLQDLVTHHLVSHHLVSDQLASPHLISHHIFSNFFCFPSFPFSHHFLSQCRVSLHLGCSSCLASSCLPSSYLQSPCLLVFHDILSPIALSPIILGGRIAKIFPLFPNLDACACGGFSKWPSFLWHLFPFWLPSLVLCRWAAAVTWYFWYDT